MEGFENRLSFTIAGDHLLVTSRWGFFGITTPISEKDREALKVLLKKEE